MSDSVIGKWGKHLAILVPLDVARSIGLTEGETVEVKTQDGDIVIRRRASYEGRWPDREDAAAEIIADSQHHTLDGLTISDLLAEGRRG